MGFYEDHFGGKEYFSKMDDGQLLDHLSDLIVTTSLSCGPGVESMLSVVFDRIAANKAEHRALVPVARRMVELETSVPHYSVGSIFLALSDTLADRYVANHKTSSRWQSLDI